MKKLILLVLVAAAAWYGYKNYPNLTSRQPSHQAVIVNSSGHPLERVRLIVDGQTLVKERIGDNDQATMEFRVTDDSDFRLVWQFGDAPGEFQWRGGRVPRGPMVQKHMFTVDGANEVIYQARNK